MRHPDDGKFSRAKTMLSCISDFVSQDDRWDNYIKIMGPRVRNNNALARQCSFPEGGSGHLLGES